MTDVKEAKAKLFYLGHTLNGRLFVNVQSEAGDFSQIEVTRNQLAGIIIDGVRFLLSEARPS